MHFEIIEFLSFQTSTGMAFNIIEIRECKNFGKCDKSLKYWWPWWVPVRTVLQLRSSSCLLHWLQRSSVWVHRQLWSPRVPMLFSSNFRRRSSSCHRRRKAGMLSWFLLPTLSHSFWLSWFAKTRCSRLCYCFPCLCSQYWDQTRVS